MCGFIGQIVKSEQERDDLSRGLPWIIRRGPDSQGVWTSADRRVTMFHARLAIVDKDSRSNQPFSNAEAGVAIAFAGEIYNYLEIKSQFTRFRFHTDSDTEIILAAYLTHGIDGLSLLKGPFSLAIVDERQKRVILARDPIGKKPLFYARWRDRLLFGTSLLSLVGVRKKSVEFNKNASIYFWQHGYSNPQATVLAEASPVLPGEILEFDWSGSILSKSSCRPKPIRIYEGEPLEEVIENVHSLLEISVKRRLRNNPKPIALLSGGIDSTVICFFLKRLCDRNNSLPAPRVLTLAPLIPLVNDGFFGIYAARRIGLELQEINLAIKIGKLADLVVWALDLQDEPLGMSSFFLLACLVKAIRGYGKVFLTGDGGDEVFLGYGKPADWYDKEKAKIIDETRASCGPKVPLYMNTPSWMSPWAQRATTEDLVGHILAMADRASIEQGVESRAPILDWDVVSYARSLPFEILTHGGRTKALLKDQLQQWPNWFSERPKLGFCYNLRWLWGFSCYSGLREVIDRRTVDTFQPYLPQNLRRNPVNWKSSDIFKHFKIAWCLLAWSRFLARLDVACHLRDVV